MKRRGVPPMLLTLLLVIMLTLTYNIERVSAEYIFVDLEYLAFHPEEFLNCQVITEGIVDEYIWIPELPGNAFLAAPCNCTVGINVEVDPLPSLGSMIWVYGTVLYGGLWPDYYIQVDFWGSLPPPTCPVHLESRQDDNASSNLGAITLDGTTLGLPDDVYAFPGTYEARYNPPSAVYTFVRWETDGCVSVSSRTSNPTLVTLRGSGLLRAIYCAEEWDVTITATIESYSDVSEFGVRNAATEGFDLEYDEFDVAPPCPGPVSYFWYPDNPSSPVDLRRLSVSKIPPSPLMNWTYMVRSVALDGLMTISWNATMVAMIPSAYGVYLQCPDGKVINGHPYQEVVDMRTVTEYSFQAESGNVYEFVVYVTSYDFELCLSPGWNLVSFPFFPIDLDVVPCFYQLFTWDGAGYISVKDPEPCTGYWMLVLSDACLTFENIVPVMSYERLLPEGWSMICSIYPCPVDADLIFSGYYQLLTWDGTGYISLTTIEPGKGYWALVLEDTYIVVDKYCCIP